MKKKLSQAMLLDKSFRPVARKPAHPMGIIMPGEEDIPARPPVPPLQMNTHQEIFKRYAAAFTSTDLRHCREDDALIISMLQDQAKDTDATPADLRETMMYWAENFSLDNPASPFVRKLLEDTLGSLMYESNIYNDEEVQKFFRQAMLLSSDPILNAMYMDKIIGLLEHSPLVEDALEIINDCRMSEAKRTELLQAIHNEHAKACNFTPAIVMCDKTGAPDDKGIMGYSCKIDDKPHIYINTDRSAIEIMGCLFHEGTHTYQEEIFDSYLELHKMMLAANAITGSSSEEKFLNDAKGLFADRPDAIFNRLIHDPQFLTYAKMVTIGTAYYGHERTTTEQMLDYAYNPLEVLAWLVTGKTEDYLRGSQIQKQEILKMNDDLIKLREVLNGARDRLHTEAVMRDLEFV